MLTIRRTKLTHRTRNGYTRASQTDEKRGMKLDGIDGVEIKNIEMLRLTPIEQHSIITWKSITVHGKSTNERCVPILQGI